MNLTSYSNYPKVAPQVMHDSLNYGKPNHDFRDAGTAHSNQRSVRTQLDHYGSSHKKKKSDASRFRLNKKFKEEGSEDNGGVNIYYDNQSNMESYATRANGGTQMHFYNTNKVSPSKSPVDWPNEKSKKLRKS